MGWVFISIFVGIAVISAISHMLKKQQQAEEPTLRTAKRKTNREEKVRLSSDAEQDRFLAEIERLRNKATTAPKAIPTVKAAKPMIKKTTKTSPVLRQKLEELPAAVVVPTAAKRKESPLPTMSAGSVPMIHDILLVSKPAAAGTTTAGKITLARSATERPKPTSPFGDDLLALLKSKNAVPMAVVLQEILGAPRCKR